MRHHGQGGETISAERETKRVGGSPIPIDEAAVALALDYRRPLEVLDGPIDRWSVRNDWSGEARNARPGSGARNGPVRIATRADMVSRTGRTPIPSVRGRIR